MTAWRHTRRANTTRMENSDSQLPIPSTSSTEISDARDVEFEASSSFCKIPSDLPSALVAGRQYQLDENVLENESTACDDHEIPIGLHVLGQRRAFIRGKKFEWDGHSINSEHRKVKETQDCIFAELENVSRKVMLLELTTDPESFLVIDFMRRLFPIAPGTVVLRYYPVAMTWSW